MNTEQQRIAIAEACGFGKGHRDGFFEQNGKLMAYRGHHMSVASVVPDYLNDLNGMNNAELSLPDEQYRLFFYELHRLRNNDCLPICKCKSAPAAQRAESFLRAIGKWIEEPKS